MGGVRSGAAMQARRGKVWLGKVEQGKAGVAGHRLARQVWIRQGRRGTDWPGKARQGRAGEGRCGKERSGAAMQAR